MFVQQPKAAKIDFFSAFAGAIHVLSSKRAGLNAIELCRQSCFGHHPIFGILQPSAELAHHTRTFISDHH
jgi:hypothetical protein